MRKSVKKARTQLGLFPTSPQPQQLAREIDQKVVALLARLLRQHADRKMPLVSHPEGGHE